MEKSLFEQMGGTYRQVGDYILPKISLSEEETEPIGIWGQRYLHYLKQHRKVLYTNILTSGKLNINLAEIDKQAENIFFQMVKVLAKKEGITEKLKAENQMERVGQIQKLIFLAG